MSKTNGQAPANNSGYDIRDHLSVLPQHLEEFQASAIDPELIDLNIRSIDLSWVSQSQGGEEVENDDILFTLSSLKWEVTRLSNGRINNPTLDRVRKMGGGWHITPFFGLADRAQINYFRFKPDNPPPEPKKPGKFKKYLGAVNESPRAYSPNVSESIWAAIACRYGVEKTGVDFWEWILDHPEIPVLITEGEKKSLAGITAGYVVISLAGIDCGYRSTAEDDGSNKQLELIPDLKALAQGERTIYIAFDRDRNRQTERRVQLARQKLARLLGELGCQVHSIKWDSIKYKGLDDFIFSAGVDALSSAIATAVNITPKPQADSVEGQKKSIPSPLEMSDSLVEGLFKDVRYDASTKQWWRYDGAGKWLPSSDEYIFGAVQKYLKEVLPDFSNSYVRNCLEFARTYILHEGWTEASNLLYIPFTNGVLEVKTGSLLPHSPDYGFTWQLPRAYSVTQEKWDNIDRFLKTLCNGNKQLGQIVLAFCNAVLKGRSDLQKFLYLFGTGANGKGSLMTLLRMLIGAENCHASTMADLNGNRFEAANLRGKRLLLMTDEDKRVGGVGAFKAATGQDPIRYERKGKDSTNFVFQGMAVVAANFPTFVGDSSYAIKRRKLDFPCHARIAEHDRRDLIPEFEADLTAFTTYLLSLSDEWVTNTIRGAGNVEAVKKLNWDMTVREDSIAAFYSDKLIIDPKGEIACGQLYKGYQSYCDESGLKAKSIKNFTPSLLELCNDSLGHSITHQHTRKGKAIQGVRLREVWEEEITDTLSATVTDVTGRDGSRDGLKVASSIEGDGCDPSFDSWDEIDRKNNVQGEEISDDAHVHISPPPIEKNSNSGRNSKDPSHPSQGSRMTQGKDSNPSRHPSPSVTTRHKGHKDTLEVGCQVRVKSIGQEGKLWKWHIDKRTACVELSGGTITDFLPVSDLEVIAA
jgi:putative DNA primase/helicase